MGNQQSMNYEVVQGIEARLQADDGTVDSDDIIFLIEEIKRLRENIILPMKEAAISALRRINQDTKAIKVIASVVDHPLAQTAAACRSVGDDGLESAILIASEEVGE